MNRRKEIDFFRAEQLLEDLFKVKETLNFSSLLSIIEKIQNEADEIEDGLWDFHNLKTALTELRDGDITISEFCSKIKEDT